MCYEKEYYGTGKALGQTIKIGGEPYTIVGVLEEQSDSSESSADQCIYIPYTNASKLSRNTSIGSYTISMKDANNIDISKAVIETKLTKILGNRDYFKIIATQEILDEMNNLMGTLKGALILIAGISLLVGGIGIMNIMLVSVTERTKEIGIRKSLGAKKKHIMQQFVIEAGTVSGIGGIIGIIAVIILIIIAPYRMDRITSFINPWKDPLGTGFQIIQSLDAIGPGGLLGNGYLNSIQKHFYLPEPHEFNGSNRNDTSNRGYITIY